MEKDSPLSDELQKEEHRKSNKWKELPFTKKSKVTEFLSGVRKKSSNVKLPPTARQESTESSLE